MSGESNNFEALRKLLTVKRHEVPPPGYFDQLAGEVRARLRAGDHHREDLWKDLGDEASWLQRLWNTLADRPALAGVCGMMACGLVLAAGIYYSQVNEAEIKAPSVAQVSQPGANLPAQTAETYALGQTPPATTVSSTNPVMSSPAPAGLFEQVPGQIREVNFSPNVSQ
jgi:hypothetical protein